MRHQWLSLLLLLWTPSLAAGMSRTAALKELGLAEGFAKSELKAAYRLKSLTAHPDKGGSAGTFIRVARAYEILSNEAHSSSASASSFDFDGSFDEAALQELFKQAEQMFATAVDELLAMDGEGAAAMVDSVFESSSGVGAWLMKSGLKAAARWLVPKVQHAMESEHIVLDVGGQKFSGADFKAWRDARQRAQPQRGTAKQRKGSAKPSEHEI